MVHKDPTAETEYSAKYKLAIDWIISVSTANLTKQEAYLTYTEILQSQLGYSLGVSTFNKTQLRPIQTIIDQA